MLELVNVSKSYESPGGLQSAVVLQGIDLTISAGQSLAVVGPSGSGKSTLLNIIGALDSPTTGKVLLDGRDISGLSDAELARIRNRHVGFVFQLHHLLPQCSVLENVILPTLVCKDKDFDAEQRAVELLKRVGLGDHLLHRPGQLSGGQRQRVAVVRAMINKPWVLLADEPTGSLDRRSSESIADLLVELNESEGVGLVVVTHSEGLARRMKEVKELKDGILVDGSGEL